MANRRAKAKSSPRPDRNSWHRSDWFSIFVILVLITAGRSSLADHYYVPSGSMENSLFPGDRVLVDKTAYGLRIPLTTVDVFGVAPPRRGDIAVFDSPEDGTLLIKRIVAVGGDTVQLRDGRLSLNGHELATTADADCRASPSPGSPSQDCAVVERFESRVARLNMTAGGGPDIVDFRVPPGMVLALGDHRGHSRDGRYFGLVHETELLGRAVRVYYRRGERFIWLEL